MRQGTRLQQSSAPGRANQEHDIDGETHPDRVNRVAGREHRGPCRQAAAPQQSTATGGARARQLHRRRDRLLGPRVDQRQWISRRLRERRPVGASARRLRGVVIDSRLDKRMSSSREMIGSRPAQGPSRSSRSRGDRAERPIVRLVVTALQIRHHHLMEAEIRRVQFISKIRVNCSRLGSVIAIL